MTNHLSAEQIENYRKRLLPPALLVAADNHIAACPSCRARLEKIARPEIALPTMRERLRQTDSDKSHISYELLESYVDQTADPIDREIVASHVEICRLCAHEFKDLRAFAVSMASTSKTKIAVERQGFWKRFFSSWTPLRLVVVTAAAMLLVVATASVWLVMRSSNDEQATVASNPWGRSRDNLNAQSKTSQESPGRGSGQTLSESQRPDLLQKAIAFALSPGRMTTITIPNIAVTVELSLANVKASDYRNLSVTLVRSFDGMTREIEPGKSSDGDEAVLVIRTSELMEGRYSITVKGEPISETTRSDAIREVASYSILVIKL